MVDDLNGSPKLVKENTFTEKSPCNACVVGCTKLTEDVTLHKIKHDGKFHYVEGQAVGVIPPDGGKVQWFTIACGQ